jgi:cytochrome P450
MTRAYSGLRTRDAVWDARTVPGNTRSLIALRDREEHKRRRQYWNRALNTQAIKEYEETLIARILTLFDELEKRAVRPNPTDSEAENQPPVDLTSWLNYFS